MVRGVVPAQDALAPSYERVAVLPESLVEVEVQQIAALKDDTLFRDQVMDSLRVRASL